MISGSKTAALEEEQRNFREQVDAWVLEAAENGKRPFGELVTTLPGIFPADVFFALRRLEQQRLIPEGSCDAIVSDQRSPAKNAVQTLRNDRKLSRLEHPLDFEWHFTPDAHAVLIERLDSLCAHSSSTVLCLGCPTLFHSKHPRLAKHRVILWDKNAEASGQMIEAQSLAKLDLRSGNLPSVEADTAVLDPPWYGDFYKLFLWAALARLKRGAHILVSFPQKGTRPSAATDLKDFLLWANAAGAGLVEIIPAALPYRTPFFETNALRANGIFRIPLDWRRGALVVLQKHSDVELPRPLIADFDTLWKEYQFGPVRIKIRTQEPNTDELDLMRPVLRRPILPTVSARIPERALANVVTSGNRFLRTTTPGLVAQLCEDIQAVGAEKLSSLLDQIRYDPRARSKLQLMRLIEREERESLRYSAAVYGP